MKKFRIYLLITLLINLNPAQAGLSQSDAGAAAMGLGTAGVFLALAGGGALLATGGIPLAAVGLYLLINPTNGTNSTPQNSPITIQLNPKVPLITPVGWTNPVAPAKQPIPPSTTAQSSFFLTAENTSFKASTPEKSCIMYFDNVRLTNPAWTYTRIVAIVGGTPGRYSCQGNNSSTGSTNAQLAVTTTGYECAAGYTISGTTCNLTTASAVIKPEKGKQEIIRTDNTFSNDPQINPNDIIANDKLTVTPSKVTANHPNGSKTEIEIQADG